MKAFADGKSNVAKMIISVFDRVENIVGKRRNCLYKQFLLFPQCFQKASFSDLSKGVIVWEWVKSRNKTRVIALYEISTCLECLFRGKQINQRSDRMFQAVGSRSMPLFTGNKILD